MPEIANLAVVISAETAQLEAGLARANKEVQGFGSQASAAGAMVTTALAGVGIAAAAGLGSAIKTAADFEKQMSAVGAVAGASASEMEQLTSAALQLGKDTSFSASEAARGIEELVKAGVSVQDVIGGGARAALDLAAAGAISVGDAAEIASNAMNVFGLKGADMAHVADVIAGAANASAIGVNDYKHSLSAAGAVAATVGISFESLSQAIAVMGNAGIKGSDAGTSLKTMMMNLIPVTDKQINLFQDLGILTADGANAFFDATGKAKSFAEIAQVLQDALKGMTKEQQLATLETMFGSDAIRAGAVLLKAGAAGFEEMAAAMGKVTAQSVANERLNNLWGSVEKLKGSLETAAIILGAQFTPALKRMADAVTDQVNVVIDAFEQIPDVIETVRQVIAGEWAPDSSIRPFTLAVGEAAIVVRDTFGPAIQAVATFITGTLIPGIQQFAEPIAAFVAGFTGAIVTIGLVTAAITALAAVLGFLLSPLGLVAIAVGALAVAWQTNFLGIQEATAELWAYLQPILTELVAWLGEKIPPVLEWISTTGWPALVTAGQAVAEFVTGTLIPGITELIDWLGPKLQPVVEWISGTGWPALVAASQEVYRVGLLVIQFVKDLWTELEKRGIVDQATAAFQNLMTILEPFYNLLVLIVGIAVKVISFLADLALKGLESGAGVQVVADAIQRFFAPIASGLDSLAKFIAMLRELGSIKLPSFSLPGFGGGGGGGSQALSWTGSGAWQATTSGGFANNAERLEFVRMMARRYGHDPETVARAAILEGAGPAGPVGDNGLSFGALQAYTGGGMGNTFQQVTGLDPRDPNNERALVEWQISQLRNTGWQPYNGPTKRGGFSQWQGINVAPTGMNRIPLAGGPGADPSEWPGFMQQTWEQLPAYLQSLDTIQQRGSETFTVVGTVGTQQGQALVSASTDALGNVTRIFSENGVVIGATITDAAGVIVNAWGSMAAEVPAQTATMAASVQAETATLAGGVLTSTTDLGDGVLTIVQDMSGNYTATITDLAGNVTSQYTQMASDVTAAATEQTAGVTEQAATMAENVLTSVTDLGDGVLTVTQDMAGNYVATITDLAGNVVETYTSMGADVMAANEDMLSTVVEVMQEANDEIGEAVEEWGSTIGDSMEGIADEAAEQASEIGQAMSEGIAEGVEDSGDAIADAVREVVEQAIEEGKDEAESDSPSRRFARELGLPIAQGVAAGIAAGAGDVMDATRSLVAVPSDPGPVLSGYAGGGIQTIRLQVELGGRVAEEIYVTGRDLATRRGRV